MVYNNAFDEIMDAYYNDILNYCNYKLKNEQDSFDCTQEVFFIFFQKQKKLKYTENIKIWLYRVADNVIKSFKRKNTKHKELDEELYTDPFDTLKETQIKSLLELDEFNILNDFYIQGKSINDISQQLEITVSTAYKRIFRAKEKLIEEITKNQIENVP